MVGLVRKLHISRATDRVPGLRDVPQVKGATPLLQCHGVRLFLLVTIPSETCGSQVTEAGQRGERGILSGSVLSDMSLLS